MKHQIFLAWALLLCSVSIAAAQITANPTTGCAPLTGVQFTPPIGATNHTWDFGNGTGSNLAAPTATFTNPGTYTVTYTGTVSGSPVSETLTIQVFASPNADFVRNGPQTGCTPFTSSFTDQSSGVGGSTITNWEWSFGDGGVGNAQNPSYNYTIPGNFTVTLKVTDNKGCVATKTQPQYVKVSSAANVVINSNPPSPTACVPPLVVTFNSNGTSTNSPTAGSLTYGWTFGDGTVSNQPNPPAVTYNTNGTFPVVLTVTDQLGCKAADTVDVVINNPVASFDVPDTVCTTVYFDDNSIGGSPYWNYGDGTSAPDSNVHTYPGPGTYTVTLTVFAGVCTDDTSRTIVVVEPFAEFDHVPSLTCERETTVNFTDQSSPSAVGWLWSFDNGDISTSQNPSTTYKAIDTTGYKVYRLPEEYTTTLIILDNHGCTASISHIDSIWPMTALFSPDVSEGCAPLDVTFYDSTFSYSDVTQWIWDFGDGNSITKNDSTPVTHTYAAPGQYQASLITTNAIGCIDTSIFTTIYVSDQPSPNFSVSPSTVCAGDSIEITDLTPTSDSVDIWYYENSLGLIDHCFSDPNATWVTPAGVGPVDITLTTGSKSCFASTTINNAVTVQGPNVRFLHQCTCGQPYDVSFYADAWGVDSLIWDFGDGNTLAGTSAATSPTHTYAARGSYLVTLTGKNNTTGCGDMIASELVKVYDPVAAFTVDPEVCAGNLIQFDASASQDVMAACARGYIWDFGDGTQHKQTDSPTFNHAYDTSGTFTVRLIIIGGSECRDTAYQSIQVRDIHADFIVDTSTGCLPLTVNFTDQSTSDVPLTNWAWDFDYSGATATGPTTSNTFIDQLDGEYDVSLIVTDTLGCKDTAVVPIIPLLPNANFFAFDRTLCSSDSVNLRASITTHQSYSWDFGDGTTGTGPTPTHAYDSAGLFDLSLTVVDTFGCTATRTFYNYMSVQDYPVAGFYSSGDTSNTLCFPIQLLFTDTSSSTSALTQNWDLGTGNPVIPSQTVGALYDSPGQYTVSLNVSTSYGCADSVIKTFNVEGPLGDFDLNDTLICRGESIEFTIKDTSNVDSWAWDFGDGYDTSAVDVVSHEYNFHPSSGQTNATLVLWSTDSACATTVQRTIYLEEVIADFLRNNDVSLADTVHCLGEDDNFTDQSVNASTWSWDLGDGTTFSQETVPTHQYTSAGIYTVTLAIHDNTTGCNDTMEKLMVINPLPTADANSGSICEGDNIQLVATGGGTYSWDPATGLSDSSIANPVAMPSQTTVYTVTVTDSNNCQDQTMATVNVFEEPNGIMLDTLIIIGQQVLMDVDNGGGYTYEWSPDEWISCNDCGAAVSQPLEDRLYQVIVRDSIGCFEVTSTFDIEVKPETTIDVPTAFTPNGDGQNDTIFVNGWGIKSLLEFKIYNRWGQLVFEATPENPGWDGYFNGKLQNMDTYTYHAVVETWLEGRVLSKTGSFDLLR